LYHPLTRKTGQRLRDYLGCAGGEEFDGAQYDYVIRWGCRRRVGRGPHEVLNKKDAIRQTSDKYSALRVFDDNDVPVPEFTRSESDIGPAHADAPLQYPVLGRDQRHSQGSDIDLILQDRDIELGGQSHHYVQYVPVATEFRVQVFDGDVLKVHEKLLRREADNEDPHIRNHERGWVFLNPRSEPPDPDVAIGAVESLGLDFGAVDLIREEGTGQEYVLEVNTAPSLDENNLTRYGDAIQEYTELDTIDGQSSVDWSEDDDSNGDNTGE